MGCLGSYIGNVRVIGDDTGAAARRTAIGAPRSSRWKVIGEWLERKVIERFRDRILAVDLAVALKCAELHVPDPRSEHDALIAATALVHNLTVVTRNTSDFVPTGVRLLNPWES